ncbi:MAG: hydantoinase/oxoprolinase family protein [Spirochaetes bacterium]|nr:hydantoinase/oxoprolinase family protein [Spirochaetota bacterium]
MYLGLDVGGTHTDAVLVNGSGVVASVKVVTDHGNLLNSVNAAFEHLFKSAAPADISRINLSTTLSTNAIVESTIEDVGMLVSAGPGIDASNYAIGKHFAIVEGSVDHRGTEIKSPDRKQVEKAVKDFRKAGVKVFAVAGKFSTRNPSHEITLRDSVAESADFITLGHRLSGQLSFPRRVTTAYYNSAVWRIFSSFSDAVEKGIAGRGVSPSINILKADGGTMPLAVSRQFPVESILSGPAASVMGIVALCDISEDSIILDIGGTTTDIAVFADGAPLIEPEGISLDGRPTLVRSLKTKSIGIGGDSLLAVKDGAVTAGPERRGPSMAEGGAVPTLIDAFNVCRKTGYRDTALSEKGIGDLAGKVGMEPASLATAAVEFAADLIRREVDALVAEINEKPVYTVHEMLEGKVIVPKKVYLMGGPAKAFAPLLEKKFGIGTVVPENYAVANAIGAALARTTIDIELFADTEKKKLIIPNLDVNTTCERDYSLAKARKDAVSYLMNHLRTLGVDAGEGQTEIIEASEFNMVGGFYATGKNIRVKCQIKPGVLAKLA